MKFADSHQGWRNVRMEQVSGLLSWTLSRVLWLSGFSEQGATMEEKALYEEDCLVIIKFTPTAPHCSLAILIGLCLRVKLQQCLLFKHKLEIYILKELSLQKKTSTSR